MAMQIEQVPGVRCRVHGSVDERTEQDWNGIAKVV